MTKNAEGVAEEAEVSEEAAEEKVDAAAEAAVDESSGEGKASESDVNDSELARLRKENDELRQKQFIRQPDTQQPKVTSAQLRGLPDAEWVKLEESTGKTRDFIIQSVETNEIRTSHAEMSAKLNVSDAMDSAAEKDPQVHKLKVYMKEYLADVPLEEKADSNKLARHIEKAKVFAKGRLAEKGWKAPAPKGKIMKEPEIGGEDDGEPSDSRAVKANQTVMLGNLKLKISDLPESLKAREKEIRHDSDPNGVKFRSGFDKKPIFKRS